MRATVLFKELKCTIKAEGSSKVTDASNDLGKAFILLIHPVKYFFYFFVGRKRKRLCAKLCKSSLVPLVNLREPFLQNLFCLLNKSLLLLEIIAKGMNHFFLLCDSLRIFLCGISEFLQNAKIIFGSFLQLVDLLSKVATGIRKQYIIPLKLGVSLGEIIFYIVQGLVLFLELRNSG